MPTFYTISAQVFAKHDEAVTAINDVADYLRSEGWVVINADVEPKDTGFEDLYGEERELQPCSFILSDVALSNQDADSAREAVKDAITQTGWYSALARILAFAQNGQDPDSPLSHAEDLAHTALVAAIVIAACVVAWRVLSIID